MRREGEKGEGGKVWICDRDTKVRSCALVYAGISPGVILTIPVTAFLHGILTIDGQPLTPSPPL